MQICFEGSLWLQWLQKLSNMALNPLESVGTMPNKFYTFNYLGKGILKFPWGCTGSRSPPTGP